MKNLLEDLRLMLRETECVISDGQRVRFINYGSSSLDIEIFAYLLANNYEQFQQRQEEVLLTISHITESNGSGFAYPSQTVYLAKDDYQKTQADIQTGR